MSEENKAKRHIKITEHVFMGGGLFLGLAGAVFTFFLAKGELGKPNIIAGAILVGIGTLAGCIRKVYERLDKIEQKLEGLHNQ